MITRLLSFAVWFLSVTVVFGDAGASDTAATSDFLKGTKISEQRVQQAQDLREHPLFTIITAPKPFEGAAWRNQKNAFLSWTKLRPQPQVILFGHVRGIDAMVKEVPGIEQINVTVNQYGTPLLDGMIKIAEERARAPVIIFMNSDLIFTNEIVTAIYKVQSRFKKFLLIGRRIELPSVEMVEKPKWVDKLDEHMLEQAVSAPESWQDYFIFSRGLFEYVPPLAIGRAYIDRWIVNSTYARKGVNVIDGSNVLLVIHQSHAYGHIKKQTPKPGSSAPTPSPKKAKRSLLSVDDAGVDGVPSPDQDEPEHSHPEDHPEVQHMVEEQLAWKEAEDAEKGANADESHTFDKRQAPMPSTTGKKAAAKKKGGHGRQAWVDAQDTLDNINVVRALVNLPPVSNFSQVNWTHTGEGLLKYGRCESALWTLQYDLSEPLHLAIVPNPKHYVLFGDPAIIPGEDDAAE
eukprot:TRINITY_DN8409_c0_g1_i1.p1 TRINITY_DN8409_c0_g1~~TRINITY_DN8409_c0_g1_i1.p1  ORF type:complete len:460 (-),score=185.88 TRINITY_DN8409_c0_g1_i1:412-1791(-)